MIILSTYMYHFNEREEVNNAKILIEEYISGINHSDCYEFSNSMKASIY